jgi:hypothetical protein
MSSISPLGPRNVDLDSAATDSAAAASGADAASGARATRVPTSIRPPIPTGSGQPARWGGPSTLATDLERLFDGGEYGDAKEMLRNALVIARSRSLERGPMITALNDAIESLARQGKLDGLIESFQLEPDLMHLTPLAADVTAFLDLHGTDAAKRAWKDESLAAQKPSAQNLTRDLTEAANLGVDSLVGMHTSRLLDLFRTGSPASDAEAKRALDGTIVALSRKGALQDVLMGLKRESDAFVGNHPNVRYYPPERQLHDLVDAHGSAECKRALAEAERLAAADASPAGTEVAKRLAEALSRSGDREVTKVAMEWLRAPQDSPKHAAIMSEAVVKLSRDGKLDDLIRSLQREGSEAFQALMRRRPGIMVRWYPFDRQVADALARSGTPEARAAWARAERAVGDPSGAERAADIAAALKGGEDREVGNAAHALLDLVNVSPPTRPRREDLNGALLGLRSEGRLDDFVRALRRIDDHARKSAPPNVRIASVLSMFDAAVSRFGSPATQRAWAAAKA